MNKNPKKSDQKVINHKFQMKPSSTQESWSSWWESCPCGVTTTTDLEVFYAAKFIFNPSNGYLISQPDSNRPLDKTREDLWFVDFLQEKSAQNKYDPTQWKKYPERRKYVSPHQRLHRKFASLSFDPEEIIEFINHFGFLGSHGVAAKNSQFPYIYAESFEEWCVQIHQMRLLVQWWDLIPGRSEKNRRTLEAWFEVTRNSGDVLQESLKTFEIPDYLSFTVEAKETSSHRKDCEPQLKKKVIPFPSAYALDPRFKLVTIVERWVDENGLSVGGDGGIPGSKLVGYEHAREEPDMFEVVPIVISEWINRTLSENTRVAIEVEASGNANQTYHLVPKTLLGAIYQSLCQEILGKRESKRVCLQCKDAFTPRRIDQKYCSSRCRQVSAHRSSRKRSKAVAKPLTAKSTAKPTPGQQKSPSQGAF
jgi:hypothetical protein